LEGDEDAFIYARSVLQFIHDLDRLFVVWGVIIEVWSPIMLVEANNFRSKKFWDGPPSGVPNALG
jgi:hypothetical protein